VSARIRIIVLIMVAQTVVNIGPLGVPAIASLIRTDLALSLAQAGSFLSMYYIGPSLISLPAGTLVDRWGVKRMLVLGQVLTAVGLLFASTAHSYTTFILLLIAAGFGYGILNPTSTKAVMAWSPPAHRATLVGFKQVGLPLGGMLGAALLPALALALGWRTALVMSAAVIAAGAIASVLVYHDPPDLVLPAATPGARGTVISVLTSRDLWLLSLAAGVFAAMQTVWMSYLVLYLQGVVGLTLLAASRFLALAQLGGMLGRVFFGLLSDRVFGGRRRMPLVLAGIGSTVCTLLILAMGAGAPTLGLAALTAFFGVVGIGWNGVQHTWLAELAGPRAAGTAVGLGLALSSAGVTLGPLLFGFVLQETGSYRLPWLGLAVAMVAALGLLTLVRERRRAPEAVMARG
jgi:MFS transporter, ACS family, hexuronate transporter